MRAILLAAALLAACANQALSPLGDLANTDWTLASETGAASPPTLTFEAGRAAGFAGCNRWFASVTQDGEALRFGNVGTTRMACTAEPAAAAERNFLAALAATRYGRYDQDALVLLDENQQQLARFERASR